MMYVAPGAGQQVTPQPVSKWCANFCRTYVAHSTPLPISQFGVGHRVHMWPQAMNFGNYMHYLAKRKRKASELCKPAFNGKRPLFDRLTYGLRRSLSWKSVSSRNGSTALDGNRFGIQSATFSQLAFFPPYYICEHFHRAPFLIKCNSTADLTK